MDAPPESQSLLQRSSQQSKASVPTPTKTRKVHILEKCTFRPFAAAPLPQRRGHPPATAWPARSPHRGSRASWTTRPAGAGRTPMCTRQVPSSTCHRPQLLELRCAQATSPLSLWVRCVRGVPLPYLLAAREAWSLRPQCGTCPCTTRSGAAGRCADSRSVSTIGITIGICGSCTRSPNAVTRASPG